MQKMSEITMANRWVVDFIRRNEIDAIPQWWAYLIETFGVLSWLCLFGFFVALLVGYSRQMSSFYFFYEHLLKEKFGNPYKPSLFFLFAWLSIQVTTFFISLAGVYFYKHGIIFGLIVLLGWGLSLAGLALLWNRMFERRLPSKSSSSVDPEDVVVTYAPAYQSLSHQDVKDLEDHSRPVELPPSHLKIEGSKGVDKAAYQSALKLFGLSEGFTKKDLVKKYHEKLKKVQGDEELMTHVLENYEILLAYCSE